MRNRDTVVISHSDLEFQRRIHVALSRTAVFAKSRIHDGDSDALPEEMKQICTCLVLEISEPRQAANQLENFTRGLADVPVIAAVSAPNRRTTVSLVRMGFAEVVSMQDSVAELSEAVRVCLQESINAQSGGRTSTNFLGESQVRRFEEYEAEIFAHALQQSGGCVSRAAVALGVGRATMYRKMRSYGIQVFPKSARVNTSTKSRGVNLN